MNYPPQNHKNTPHRNADVSNLFCRVRVTRIRTEPFHPSIGDTIEENDEGFHKFGGVRVAPECLVPCPAVFSKGSEKTGKSKESITPKMPPSNIKLKIL